MGRRHRMDAFGEGAFYPVVGKAEPAEHHLEVSPILPPLNRECPIDS
jgi:hypothetical protein